MTRILLVEDDELNRDMLGRRLSRRGFDLELAVDGVEAIEKANAVDPDLILMDLSLPGMDGWEVTKILKQDDQTRQIPIIALTAHAQAGDRERALEVGCDDYDTKPVDLPRLIDKMRTALARAETAVDAVVNPAGVATKILSPKTDTPEDDLSSSRLLVVDDNADNREVLSRRLERRGYSVETAESGEEALDRIAQGGVHLVLLDVMMPGLGGMETLARIREQHSQAELPVIMATARTEAQDVVEALRLGANDYVSKPLDFDIVLARVETHLATARQARSRSTQTRRIRRVDSGEVLDERYELGEMLGRGGCAVVHAARQVSTGQQVAVKIVEIELDDDVAKERFKREMDVIARLRHPHVVRLIDSGEVERVKKLPDGQTQLVSHPYLVMELLEGESLMALLRRDGGLSASQTADIVLPVTSALQMAHEAGLVHRDVKPGNIILTRGPGGRQHPMVLDFGIAKHARTGPEDLELTDTAAMVGTPRYLAPEQARGAKEVDARADQFSLGMVMLECLSGKSVIPTELGLFQMLYMITSGELPRARELAPDAPEAFEAVIERAMAQDPAARFPSMREMGAAVLPFASEASQAIWRDELTA